MLVHLFTYFQSLFFHVILIHHKVENELENYKELKRTKENIFLREVFPLKVENEFGHDTLIVENYEEFKRTKVKLGRI